MSHRRFDVFTPRRAAVTVATTAAITVAMTLTPILTPLATAHAQIFDVAATPLYDERASSVAYNPSADELLTVWQSSTDSVIGQLRTGDGTVIDDYVPLLDSWSTGADYYNPRVTFKTAQNLYVVVAAFETGPYGFQRGIVAAAFDGSGALQWVRDVATSLSPAAQNPVVVADTYGTSCCILVAWEDAGGDIRGVQLDASGAPVGATLTLFDGSGSLASPYAMNPAVAYQRSPGDDFYVVYQLRQGAGSSVVGRAVGPVSGALGAPTTVAALTENPAIPYGERFTAGTALTYNEVSDTYLVAWSDDGAVRGQRLTAAGSPTGSPIAFGPSSHDTPSVVSSTASAHDLVTWGYYYSPWSSWLVYGVSLVGTSVTGTYYGDGWLTEELGRSAAAYGSARDTFWVTWDRDEPGGTRDVRGAVLPGPVSSAILDAFEACGDGVYVGQSSSIAGVTCTQVCAAFGFAGCSHRAAQSGFDACTPVAPPATGTCSDVFAASWSSQCACVP